jgi:hypothetical protein
LQIVRRVGERLVPEIVAIAGTEAERSRGGLARHPWRWFFLIALVLPVLVLLTEGTLTSRVVSFAVLTWSGTRLLADGLSLVLVGLQFVLAVVLVVQSGMWRRPVSSDGRRP